MKTLVITNDYFPKKGGISTYIKSFEDHLEFEKIIYAPNWAEGPNVVNSKSRFIFGSRTHLREINQIINDLPTLNEWHSKKILNNFDNISWNVSIKELHKPENVGNYKKNFYQRLAFDEIFSTFLVNSEIRKKIKKVKKKNKIIDKKKQNKIIDNLDFNLTDDQIKTLKEINSDLSSTTKMFRLLQGDVGSGKTIVSLLAAFNTINAGYQVAIMAPTEILARQHFNLTKKLFPKKFNIELISGKSDFNLTCISPDEFPVLEDNMDEQYIEVPSFEFLKIIHKTKFAISNDETRHYLNGVYLDKNETQNQLVAVATDGHRLSKSAIEFKGKNEFQPIISGRYTAFDGKNYKSVILKNITLYFICKSCSKPCLKKIFLAVRD